jgi:2-polyprenyl-6-methoxyphenol hydroxylase-like FAD-dependent oxidoreductase
MVLNLPVVGSGGSRAAAGLAQRRWEVVVHERQVEVRAAGSGIYVWENGLRVLDAIGASVPHGASSGNWEMGPHAMACGPQL